MVGFLSVILYSFTDYRIAILSWADPYQPLLGIVVGIVGVGLIVVNKFMSKPREEPAS
ncbi:hypothetical protein [Pseudonocardia sp. TRM90224]|uniref:hypothetical protein n=1 Tax=Pseudonocardia sp. TRM90224 TaxID=2812678 RepID=UPI001E2E52C8|nr:hypothetical protein [Pseudonocardia sp. TRM90224]